MQSWIECQQVQKTVDEVKIGPFDLTIEPGTITAIVGNNGSGKSSLMKLIMNLAKPDQGEILRFGETTEKNVEGWKESIAYMPQSMPAVQPYTGQDLRDLISQWYPNWDEDLFQTIVERLDIPLNKKFRKLSQGVQQKLQLALTIPRNTPIMMLDEPTAHIDLHSQEILMELLVEWMEGGERAIVITSHQLEDIKKLADYIVVMKNGAMVGRFEKEELTESHRQYWLTDSLPDEWVPGEMVRPEARSVITNKPHEAEGYFEKKQLSVADSRALELGEILSKIM